ncbi:S9 family peptidase [Roseisolibacter agri]|uniref:Peptidase S9 n=1 Tax=Roseisolibacter agri TaxID=2014610 RepID=A0AA37QD00_9BACT|nr:S9 family peptidase [Roseisolibacter agri]GLC24045.1 peptidase S9 [Roseisolibacter agri]
MRHASLRRPLVAAAIAASLASAFVPALGAQQPAADTRRLTVERIFGGRELTPFGAPGVRWMKDGRSYVAARAAEGGRGTELVRVDALTGAATVLVPASVLVDARGQPIAVEELELSPDERKALLFSNSVRVWRTNTRGTYHVVDFDARRVIPIAIITTPGTGASRAADSMPAPALGQNPTASSLPSFIGRGLASGAADPDLQQFAKFSPDSRSVAYVRANDLWVKDLASGAVTRLTTDGSDDVINGTTDWVYEEELGLQDAFRWSPDSRRLAYWRFDQHAVPAFPMVNETAEQYPLVSVLRYPKAGAPNSRVTVGVVAAAGGPTKWMDVGPDTGQYVARMEWVDADSIAVQRLPRKQDRLDLLLVSATTGRARTVLTDRDSAYVDVEGEAVRWLDGRRRFLYRSDRGGWRGWWLYDRSGRLIRQVTPNGADHLSVAGVDERAGVAYVTAAAPTPTERNLYRCALAGAAPSCTRVTAQPGTHAVDVAPGARWAIDTWSRLGRPPVVTLHELPAMRTVRTLEDNAAVAQRLAALELAAPQFLRVPMADGTQLDAYRLVPPRFDSTQAHPVLMYVYGGPAAPQVNDAWSGTRFLWHQMLAQQGYVVLVVDNRGAAWRGRDFRKLTQYRLGVQESSDQIEAARWVARQPWADAKRVGIWGWSYGGYMTALSLARGGSVFKAGIAVAPVVDWRFYDTIYTERFMWTPQENPNGYQLSAVGSYVNNLTARLLLVHGTGDDNVHPQNSTVLADLLQQAGKPFTMMLYPNRTHSISGGRTQVHLFDTFTRFVLENL